jgi:transcriptional regulator with XRE-family HTH domain
MIEPPQIRAARALLGWRQEDLSKASGVGAATVRRIERANSNATSYISTLARIQVALETAGIEFMGDDGSAGMGVRIAKSKKNKKK